MLNNKSAVACKVKALSTEGTFSAYGNVFGVVDNVNDVTVKGTFTNSIKSHLDAGTTPKLLAQHGHTTMPIGVITSMKEDDYGLYFEGEFCLDTQMGKETHALVKQGAIDQFSIGYKTIKERYDTKRGANLLEEVEVKEISIVTFACNEASKIVDVKSAIESGDEVTPRMVQKALQESGLSKRQAEAAVNAIKSQQETEIKLEESIESFKARAESHEIGISELKGLTEDTLNVKGAPMSIRDYANNVSDAARNSVKAEDNYVYAEDVLMDSVIVCVCKYTEDTYEEKTMRIPYTVKAGDILVGTGEDVTRMKLWVNETERKAVESAFASDDPEVKAVADEPIEEPSLIEQVKTADIGSWFEK